MLHHCLLLKIVHYIIYRRNTSTSVISCETVAWHEPLDTLSLHVLNSPCLLWIIIIFIFKFKVMLFIPHVETVSINIMYTTSMRIIVVIVIQAIIKMVYYSIFAIGTCVPALKPFFYTWWVKPMEAWQDHVLLIRLIMTHAYRAGFILLWKVGFVILTKLREGKRFY